MKTGPSDCRQPRDRELRDDSNVFDPSSLSFYRPNSPPNTPFFFSFLLFVLSSSVSPFCSLRSFDLKDITDLAGEAINPISFFPLLRFPASSAHSTSIPCFVFL